MSNPEVYENRFEGYTTTFYVWRSHRECIIRWENISPVEVVIPYTTDLTPSVFKAAISRLVERAEDVMYEEYPFRSILRSSTEFSSTYEIYWEPQRKYGIDYDEDMGQLTMLPRVRILSTGHADSITHRTIAIDAIMRYSTLIEENLINIMNTLRY